VHVVMLHVVLAAQDAMALGVKEESAAAQSG
jgi:hypothetical protein